MAENPYLQEITPFLGLEERLCVRTALAIKTLRRRYAWAVPSDQAARTIARHAPRIVEVGAGSGYWKWFLAQEPFRIAVLAYDIGGETKARWTEAAHAEVADAAPEIAARHPDRALMLVKPTDTPDDEHDWERVYGGPSFAITAFREYAAAGGTTLIHVGHPYYFDERDPRVPGLSVEERILGKTYVLPGTPFPAEWKLVETLPLPTYDDKGMGPEGVYIFRKEG